MDGLRETCSRRAILDDPGFGEAEVYCGNAECLKRTAGGPVASPDYCCEAAGATFARRFDFAGQEATPTKGKKAGEDGSADNDSEDGEEYGKRPRSPKDKAAGGALKLSDLLKDVDLYELLGVSEAATEADLKKAYRHLVLTAHPDKLDQDTDEATAKKAQENFVKIQEAYELLSDPQKRLQYDSSLDFDDSLPRFKASAGEDFFEVFGEAFRRNARFSTRRPVPDVGDADTKPETWKRFYDFWYSFSSWRCPIALAQKEGEELHDLEEAECREEKRWMMRENERIARRYRQAEKDRICDLVRLAEKYDPRVAAEKEAKKAARAAEAAKREEERMAVQRKKEEAERIKREAEEAERAAEAEKRAKEKAARELVKNEVKKCRQRLRGLHPSVAQFVLLDQLNEVCLHFEQDKLQELGDKVEKALKAKSGGAEAGAALIHEAIESIGMKPVTVVQAADEDLQSTSSGQSSEEVDPEELKRRQVAAKKAEEARKEKEKKRAAEQKQQEAERAIREAEKAEEKKKRDAEKKKEQEALLAKKRQQEKKEEEKLKKAAKAAEAKASAEEAKKEQQREEAKQRALEQAEKDKAEAAAKRAEMEGERVAQLFATDRNDRLGHLDAATEEALGAALQAAVEAEPALGAALLTLKASEDKEVLTDRAMALVYKVGPIWHLGLLGPPEVKLPNAVRNRVKKARQRLRDTMTAFLAKGQLAAGAPLSDWQQGIVDGTVDIPVWSPEEREEEERAAKAAKEAAAPKAAAKKSKKAKEPKGEDEDLDKILAELGATNASPEPKKSGKKKK